MFRPSKIDLIQFFLKQSSICSELWAPPKTSIKLNKTIPKYLQVFHCNRIPDKAAKCWIPDFWVGEVGGTRGGKGIGGVGGVKALRKQITR